MHLPLALNNEFEWIRSVDFELLDLFISDDIYAEVVKSILENRLDQISIPALDYITNSKWAIIKEEKSVNGMVVIVDYFGNIITNIHIEDIASYLKKFKNISIFHRNKEIISGIVENYNDVILGEKMCRINDLGFLEIAMNKGSASSLLGIIYGQPVKVIFS